MIIARYGVKPCCVRKIVSVGAEADECLLADRDEPTVARERVPHHREDHEDQQHGQLLVDVRAEEERHHREHGDDEQRDRHRRDRHARPALHTEPAGERARCAARITGRGSGERGCRPRGGEHGEEHEVAEEHAYCGLTCSPITCATPSTMPPSSVPHAEPNPPITTASKAKISCVGPVEGSKVERIARNMPPSAAVATAIAVASRVDGARVDADQLGRVRVLGGGTHLASGVGAREEQLQAGEHDDAVAKVSTPKRGNRKAATDADARRRERDPCCSAASGHRARTPGAGRSR